MVDVVAKVKLKKERNGRPMVNSLKRDLARQPRASTSKGERKSKLGQDQDTITGPRKGTGTVTTHSTRRLSAFDVLRADSQTITIRLWCSCMHYGTKEVTVSTNRSILEE